MKSTEKVPRELINFKKDATLKHKTKTKYPGEEAKVGDRQSKISQSYFLLLGICGSLFGSLPLSKLFEGSFRRKLWRIDCPWCSIAGILHNVEI
ncbi:hypothetical protein SLE2022_207230 [Rubroshorea leprosula]